MNVQKKANILVLIDEHGCRHVFRIFSYILFKEKHFILVTNEKHFELLQIFSDDSSILVHAINDDITEIQEGCGLPIPLIKNNLKYRAVGLMFTEDVKEEASRAFIFKSSIE